MIATSTLLKGFILEIVYYLCANGDIWMACIYLIMIVELMTKVDEDLANITKSLQKCKEIQDNPPKYETFTFQFKTEAGENVE